MIGKYVLHRAIEGNVKTSTKTTTETSKKDQKIRLDH